MEQANLLDFIALQCTVQLPNSPDTESQRQAKTPREFTENAQLLRQCHVELKKALPNCSLNKPLVSQ